MFKRHIVSAAALACVATLALPAFAQQQPVQSLERVEVTGSNIRRVQSETASPVQRVSREDIEKSGKGSVAELLQTLAVDNQGSVPTTFGSGFAAGASGISLRGLGAASTLVLINGRRVAPYGLADDGQKVFTDLNLVPLEAVDRVEILKDGASSIYGSDAIAGVVNVILRKDFKGSVGKVTYGQSRYGDGKETHAAITHGFGDLAKDGYNVLLNLELGKKDAVWNSDRSNRAYIGKGDLRNYGFDAEHNALGGTGAIVSDRGAAGSSIIGNVRNPDTLEYFSRDSTLADSGFTRTFPGAACSKFSSHPQGDPLGGCLIDGAQQYGQIQPDQKTTNFFGRVAKNFGNDLQVYSEVNLYKSKSDSNTTPSGVSASVGYPGGPVSNAGVALGAAHPDNPYFGTAARVRYLATDVGPRTSHIDSTFTRFIAGAQGTFGAWDFDTAFLLSENKVSNSRNGYLQRDVTFALLNPTATNVANATKGSAAYAALPAGSLWRIAENAGLNSAALYAALSPTISNDAKSTNKQIDFKMSRELGELPGGPMGLALGVEARRETVRLDPTSGTDRGNIIGLGYSAYEGSRTLTAAYAELLAPVLKSFELTGALRIDHYSDVGSSHTPKIGFKWTPAREFALRGTYAEGFRAPSAAENGKGGLAAFSTAKDPVRCALGVQSACTAGNVALITSPNPGLKPEKSKSSTLGVVWEPASSTSLSLDLWQIKRINEINQGTTAGAIAAGRVSRDPTTAIPSIPGDPGGITAVLVDYVNSNRTTVNGFDFDGKQRFDLGSMGRLTLDAKWTHMFKFERVDGEGVQDFAGTHGNCDVTNCIGTPADRVNAGATWDGGALRIAANVNYRAALKNVNFKNDPAGCAFSFADGSDAPKGCRLASFTTLDLSFRWKASSNFELTGSIQNLFDRVAPLDPLTYGATSYNPLDYSGAMGRYFTVGARYSF